jgi:GntR family transcriptional regulator
MGTPMYRQIAEDLREQIDSGGLQPGQRLRTEIELRERYGASRNTVRDAIKWLTTLGLVETRPGQGTFVVRKIEPYITTLTADPRKARGEGVVAHGQNLYGEVDESDGGTQKRQLSNTDPQVEIQKASGYVSAQLDIPEGSSVISRHQKRYIDGTPWSLQTSYYPRGFAQRAERLTDADDMPGGTVKYLSETLGLRQVGYRDWITVRAPEATEAVFFGLPQDGRVGVYEIFRTAFDQTGTPMRLTVTVFPTDRNQFVVNVGDVPDENTTEKLVPHSKI